MPTIIHVFNTLFIFQQWLVIALLFVCTATIDAVLSDSYCRPHQSCWPSNSDLQTFKLMMNSTASRVMLPS